MAEKAAAANLQSCGDCADDFARELGADYAVTGVVYKVSELVLSMNVRVRDAASSTPLTSAVVDMRGNTDRIWRRAIDYLYRRRAVGKAGEAEEMTKMLASVTGVAEAEIAISGGADIVDLKDPKAGALGRGGDGYHPPDALSAVPARRAETSAVCGDLPMHP